MYRILLPLLIVISGCEPLSTDVISTNSADTILECVAPDDSVVFFYIDGKDGKVEIGGQQYSANFYENQNSELVFEMPLFGSRTVINKKTGEATIEQKKRSQSGKIACKNK